MGRLRYIACAGMLLAASPVLTAARTPMPYRSPMQGANAACAALGNYPVGARAAATAHVAHGLGLQPPPSPWRLAGNLIITAYQGCGRPTAGTFSIQGELMGTSVESGGVTVTLPCAESCLGPTLTEVTASGTFARDAAHARDPMYVTITTTITRTISGKRLRVMLANLTGYLRVTPGQNATLSFLPPPTVSFLPAQVAASGTLPIPLVIYGWRGM